MIVQIGPNIVDSISESLQFYLCNGYLLDDGMLKVLVLIGNEILKMVDFLLAVFEEGHDERFELKTGEEVIEVIS